MKGLEYTGTGYLSVFDKHNHQIYILNANNYGDIVLVIVLPLGSMATITSYNNLFYVFYESNVLEIAGLLSINPETGIVKSLIDIQIEEPNPFRLQSPTFCSNGDIIILYDVTNIFSAYNTNTFEKIWSYQVESDWVNWIVPPVCIEPNKILYPNNTDDAWQWQVSDVTNGNILHTFYWYNEQFFPPAINVDKQILLITDWNDDTQIIIAIDISDSDPNNWNDIWTINVETLFKDIIIVDDSIILSNEGQKIVVLDINNGKELWYYYFQDTTLNNEIHVTPGIQNNGDAILIANYQQPGNLTCQYFRFFSYFNFCVVRI